MEKLNDGGPAFPGCGCNPENDRDYGMSLRDYFAAKALPAVTPLSNLHTADQIAGFAYELADAMLEAREAPREQ